MEQREIDMDKKLTSAFLGYARYDVVANQSGMTFKRWNDRKLEQPQVNALLTSFKVDGVNRFKASNSIPLVISKGHIKMSTINKDENSMEDLKEMELTDEAKKLVSEGKAVIYVASGQHRIAALAQYQEFLEKIRAESLKTRQRLEKLSLDDVDKMEIDDENKIEKPKRDIIDGSLALKGQWMVSIYNYGKHGFQQVLCLCANRRVCDMRHTMLSKNIAQIHYPIICATGLSSYVSRESLPHRFARCCVFNVF